MIFGRPILDRYHKLIADFAPKFESNLVVCSGVGVTPEAAVSLAEASIPHLEDPELCIRAIARLAHRSAPQKKEGSVFSRQSLRRKLSKETFIGRKIYDALVQYGVSTPKSHFVESMPVVLELIKNGNISYPVAVKSAMGEIPHKTESSCVVLNVKDAQQLQEASDQVFRNIQTAAPKASPVVEIQQMSPPGYELLVSITQDNDFGPICVVGIGGITTELLDDTSILTFPASSDQIVAAMQRLKGWPLLNGYRGKPPADLQAFGRLWDAIVRMYQAEAWIGEIEFNPVIVGSEGKGATVVDALVTVAE